MNYQVVPTYEKTGPPEGMPAGTSDEWLFDNWQLIARALTNAEHEGCRCYGCDTIDVVLKSKPDLEY